MTCGIYKLNFADTDKVYIGQSVYIEKRFKQHVSDMKAGRASPKMQEAFKLYGTPISYTVLVECAGIELDDNEIEAIEIFNSVENGFNTYSSPLEAPSYKGYGYGRTKYTEESLYISFELLAEGKLTYKEIEKITGIPSSTIGNIARGYAHAWLFEKYSDIAKKVLAVNRVCLGVMQVSNKLSAKSRGIIYKKVKSPSGQHYQVDNAYSFAREHGLAGNHLTEVLNGRRKSHKGWKLCPEEQV
jgi:RNase P/RNase MRP subunit POP5